MSDFLQLKFNPIMFQRNNFRSGKSSLNDQNFNYLSPAMCITSNNAGQPNKVVTTNPVGLEPMYSHIILFLWRKNMSFEIDQKDNFI